MLIENQGHNFRLKKIHYLLFFNRDWHTAGKAEIRMHRERKDILQSLRNNCDSMNLCTHS